MKNMVKIIRLNVLLLFVVLSLSNSLSFAHDVSLEQFQKLLDAVLVVNARLAWNEAGNNAGAIKDELDELTGDLSLAEYAIGDNAEEIADGLFSVLGNLSLDPVAISVGVAVDGSLAIGDLVESWSLEQKRTWISNAVDEIDKVLSRYETNVAVLKDYYDTLNEAYIEKYGEPVDPNAPQILAAWNWCELGDECGSPKD